MTCAQPAATMKAWTCKNYSEDPARAAKAMSLTEVMPVPTPGKAQVLVKVHFAAVDPVDWNLIVGAYKDWFPVKCFPFVPGFDAAGEVSALGPDCAKFKVGDRVVLGLGLGGSCSAEANLGPSGAFAEYCMCPESQIAKVPSNMDFSAIAGLPTAGLTAYQALFTGHGASLKGEPLGHVTEGSKVLVLGGDRGVGHLAVQMAAMKGATVVSTTSLSKLIWVQKLGASRSISYEVRPWLEQLKDLGLESHFDLILDCVGWATSRDELDKASEMLRPGGQYISIGTNVGAFHALGSEDALPAGCHVKTMLARCNSEDLEQLVQWVADGTLKVYVDRIYPFTEARHALHHSILSLCSGKVLLCQCSASSGARHVSTGAPGGA